MAKFRMKSPIVEARQWCDIDELLPGMMRSGGPEKPAYFDSSAGPVLMEVGDWLVTYPRTELYPQARTDVVKPREFNEKWEAVLRYERVEV